MSVVGRGLHTRLCGAHAVLLLLSAHCSALHAKTLYAVHEQHPCTTMAAVLAYASFGRRRLWDRPEHLQQLLDAARGRAWAWVQGQQQQQGQAWGCCSLRELLQGFFVFYQDLFSDWLLGKRRCVHAGKQAGRQAGRHLPVALWVLSWGHRLHTLRARLQPIWFQGPHPRVGGMCVVCSKQSRPDQGQLGVLRSAPLVLLLLLPVQGGVCRPVGGSPDLAACST